MAKVGDLKPCVYPGCPAEMVLQKKGPEPGFATRRMDAGEEFAEVPCLHAWICRTNSLHVDVVSWGLRPTKRCTHRGCDGVMVHSDKGGVRVPEDIAKNPGQLYPMLKFEPGFVCLEDPYRHFEPTSVAP